MAKTGPRDGLEAAIFRSGVEDAASRIVGQVRETPVHVLEEATFDLDVRPTPKLLQHSGSFKARSAFNRIPSSSLPSAGVVPYAACVTGLVYARKV